MALCCDVLGNLWGKKTPTNPANPCVIPECRVDWKFLAED